MFEDSLIESGNKLKTKRLGTTVLSFFLQVGLIGVLILIPLIYTDALPKTQLMTFLVAPPPPPPPPPPPAAAPVKVVKIQSEVINGQLRTPTAIPKKVQMIKEEEAPPDLGAGGVPGGVPGGLRAPHAHADDRALVACTAGRGCLGRAGQPAGGPLGRSR